MLNLLATEAFEAAVVCPGGGSLERELDGLQVKRFNLEFGKYSLVQNPLWHAMFLRKLNGIVQSARPEVVAINLDGNTALVAAVAALHSLPMVRFCRFEFREPQYGRDRWAWRRASAIICPSHFVAGQVRSWMGASGGKCFTIYESCTESLADARAVANFRAQHDLGPGPVVGYIGRIHRQKSVEIVIRAIALVRQGIQNVKLVIVGSSDGSAEGELYRRDLEALVNHLNLVGAVTFIPAQVSDQMPAIYGALDVCVLASSSESFGMTLMEAWAQGIPTVATDIGACREISVSSKAGKLAKVGDAQHFADEIRALLTDEDLRQDLGRNGRAWVQTHCRSSRYAEEFEAVLSFVLKGGSV